MKILSLSIQNYLGASSLETSTTAPIILLAARNGAGAEVVLGGDVGEFHCCAPLMAKYTSRQASTSAIALCAFWMSLPVKWR